MKDETAIVIGVTTAIAVAMSLPLFSILSQIPKR